MQTPAIPTIVEVGPRDGLQNETAPVPTAVKIAFVDALSSSGAAEIEVSAFVSPRWVPQLDDAAEVFAGITRRDGVVYSALVPNIKGMQRALAAGVDKVSVFTAASETFSRKNINATIAASIDRFRPVAESARSHGIALRGYVSTAFWCAFEGRIAPRAVVDVVDRLIDIGVDEISVADTIGKAAPDEIGRLFERLFSRLPADRLAIHVHDTYGRGVANVLAAWSMGIRTIDASAGGLGGCPYAPGASGNVSTQDVVAALEAEGVATGIDRLALDAAGRLLDPFLRMDRRSLPVDGSPACAACQFSTGEVCCGRFSTPAG